MTDSPYLANQFLIAMPGLEDPNFFHSVTYICEHNEEGALGLVINRPTDLLLGDILEHMSIENMREDIAALLENQGGVMTATELAEALLSSRGSMQSEPVRTRQALAVLRAAVETERDRAAAPVAVRRHRLPDQGDVQA